MVMRVLVYEQKSVCGWEKYFGENTFQISLLSVMQVEVLITVSIYLFALKISAPKVALASGNLSKGHLRALSWVHM